MNQDEAKIRLQSKPLAAGLWLEANDTLEEAIKHLPDPAFTASQNWPEYSAIKKEEALPELSESQKLKEGVDIEFIKSPVIEIINETSTNDVEEVLIEEKIVIETETWEEIPEIPEAPSQTEMKHSKKIARITKKAIQTEEKKADKKPKKKKEPEAKVDDFYSWLMTMSNDSAAVKTREPKPKKAEKAAKKPKSEKEKDTAEKSLKLGEEIVSETLARLLARQGYKEDAIAMYEKLRKKYPQKDTTFAAAIEKLKS